VVLALQEEEEEEEGREEGAEQARAVRWRSWRKR
jgi:hypothetical protein